MTAVEYLQKQLFERFVWSDTILFLELIDKAKEMEVEQSNDKIQKAIELFEEVKIQADTDKDLTYLDNVLAVLDGIKNTKL
jgi:hypothetical protein